MDLQHSRFRRNGTSDQLTILLRTRCAPFALGRRNWIHIGSEEAGPRVAAIVSIVETCRRLKIPVRDYLLLNLAGLGRFPDHSNRGINPWRMGRPKLAGGLTVSLVRRIRNIQLLPAIVSNDENIISGSRTPFGVLFFHIMYVMYICITLLVCLVEATGDSADKRRSLSAKICDHVSQADARSRWSFRSRQICVAQKSGASPVNHLTCCRRRSIAPYLSRTVDLLALPFSDPRFHGRDQRA